METAINELIQYLNEYPSEGGEILLSRPDVDNIIATLAMARELLKKHGRSDATALLIAHQTERGMSAFVVAGAEILQRDYGFTEEQAAAWATETVRAGGKYLRVSANETAEYTTRIDI